MYSQYWNTVRGHRPDYRRYTVVEGDTPLPLGSTGCRKRLRSAGGDEEEVRSCASRPNPEGSLSASELSRYGKPEEEELRRLCQRCHIVTSQLNRQAAALADSTTLKDPVYTSFLLDKLQRLQWPRRGRHAPVDAHCDVCGASFQQLRRLALRRALGIGRDMTPRPAGARLATEGSWGGEELPPKQQRWSCDEQQGGVAPWGWGGVQSIYLGGGGVKGLATVTPLPLNTQHYLEGVWRVSCCRPEHQQHTTASSSDGVYVTMRSSTPATHSTATQTSHPPSAAAAFFISRKSSGMASSIHHREARRGRLTHIHRTPPEPDSNCPGFGSFNGRVAS